jgi:hypothetical protein
MAKKDLAPLAPSFGLNVDIHPKKLNTKEIVVDP